MGRYLLRRLLIAVPSLIGISIVLFTVLALAPGDPFGELATNPNVFGLARPPFTLMSCPAKSKFSRGDQASLMTSSHSCA